MSNDYEDRLMRTVEEIAAMQRLNYKILERSIHANVLRIRALWTMLVVLLSISIAVNIVNPIICMFKS